MTIAEVGTDGMLLAYERISGRSLDSVPADAFSPELLQAIWRLVADLDRASIAHRDLRLANLLLADGGVPWMIDFGFAELAAPRDLVLRDVAELLASTAAVVGPERAARAAIDVLGREHVAEALQWIQPLGLSTATRTSLGRSKDFKAIRAAVAAAVGVDEVAPVRLERISGRTVFVLLSVALAIYVLVPQFAEANGFLDEVRRADIGWTAITVVFSILTYVGAAIGIMGAVRVRLPLGPVISAQVASSFASRITPAKVGGLATNVRFLQRRSIPSADAVSAVGLNTIAGFVVHVTLLLLVSLVAGTSNSASIPHPSGRSAILVLAAVMVVSALTAALPLGRRLFTRNLAPALRSAWQTVASVAKTPSKLATLFLGSLLVTSSYTLAMVASLNAMQADLPVATAAVVYLVGAAIATAAPTPGGIGATEAALIAGYAAVGVDPSAAFAAVLLFRLVTFWLPIVPGWVALVALQRRGQL